MGLQGTELFILAVAVLLFAWYLSKRPGKKTSTSAEVITVLEDFADKMEEENERLVEMISLLRQKLDQQEMDSRHTAVALREQSVAMENRLRLFEGRMDALLAPPPDDGPRLPDYLSPRYRAAAERLLRGEVALTIMRDMDMGQGEIDLVSRLLESERGDT